MEGYNATWQGKLPANSSSRAKQKAASQAQKSHASQGSKIAGAAIPQGNPTQTSHSKSDVSVTKHHFIATEYHGILDEIHWACTSLQERSLKSIFNDAFILIQIPSSQDITFRISYALGRRTYLRVRRDDEAMFEKIKLAFEGFLNINIKKGVKAFVISAIVGGAQTRNGTAALLASNEDEYDV